MIVRRTKENFAFHLTDSTARSTILAEKSQLLQQQSVIVASAIPQNLIDSFAQTDAVDNTNRDMVDSGLSIHARSSYKERNISITEEDEPISLSYEPPHYIGVTEEEEKPSDGQRNEVS